MPSLEGERRELLGPVGGPPAQEPAPRPERPRHVVEPPHGLRGTPGRRGRLVDPGVHRPEGVRGRVALARQPAVREPPGEPQHPRLEGTHPDSHRVRRSRPRVQPDRPVVRPVEPNAALARPHRADDADGLLERLDRLTRGEAHPARCLDGVPEGTRPDAELDPSVAQDVERRDRPGEHDGVAQRQVRHVERNPHRRGARRDHRQQGPGVEVARPGTGGPARSRGRAR